MVFTYTFAGGEPLSLAEYIDYVDRNVDVHDADSLASSAEHLYRLSLNDTLLGPLVLEPIKKGATEVQAENLYTDATFLLGFGPSGRFYVRANVWKVPKLRAGSEKYENVLYSYEQPHDHNFDFLTVGYLGPGYATRLYTYDNSKVIGYPGEHVEVAFCEETMLHKGKVMFYRKSVDIHTQKAPDALSVSLNLMIPAKDQMLRQQYFFDPEENRITALVGGAVGQRIDAIEMAAFVGGAEMIEPLQTIAEGCLCPRTRAKAIESLLRLAPQERDGLLSRFGADSSPLVQMALA